MRSFRLLSGTVLIFSALAFAQTPSPKPPSAFDEQLINQQKQFLQATENKDVAAVERAVADDFRGIAVNGDFYDKGEVIDSANDRVPQGTRTYDFHVVKLSDDAAVVAYNLIVPGGHPRYRHMADTWARVGGQWKLKFRQISLNLWSASDLD